MRERPYAGVFNSFVVTDGLPIPDGCPQPLTKLMNSRCLYVIIVTLYASPEVFQEKFCLASSQSCKKGFFHTQR